MKEMTVWYQDYYQQQKFIFSSLVGLSVSNITENKINGNLIKFSGYVGNGMEVVQGTVKNEGLHDRHLDPEI